MNFIFHRRIFQSHYHKKLTTFYTLYLLVFCLMLSRESLSECAIKHLGSMTISFSPLLEK